MNKYPPTVNVNATGFPDAWYKLVRACLTEGALKRRFYGKPVNTLDIVSLTEIRRPFIEPMLHPDFPTKEIHLSEYKKQFERDYDWKKQGFEYNYVDRLVNYPEAGVVYNEDYYNKAQLYIETDFIDQLSIISDRIADRIEKGGECLVSNRDQAITWIPDRDLFVQEDQPCLQRIQFFVYEYPEECTGNSRGIMKRGKGDFHVTWRSRDLYAAWNTNMVALTEMINREIFAPNNIEIVRVVDFCNSLHIYEGDWESARLVKPAVINPMFMR